MSGGRALKGFALAPLPAVVPLLLMFGLILARGPSDWAGALTAMIQMVLLSYGAALLVGLPVHLVLQKIRRRTLLAYVSATVLTVTMMFGAAAVADQVRPAPANPSPFALHPWSRLGITLTIVFAFFAAFGAGIFWTAAVKQAKALKSAIG